MTATEIGMVFEKAEKGKRIIDTCVPDSNDNNVIVIFPDDDKELLDVAYKYFDRFLSDYDLAIVIASVDVSELNQYTDRPFKVVQISNEEMECVLRYASMISVPYESLVGIASIKVISLKKPFCQKLEILKGVKDITLDKLVCRSLYEIWGTI